MFVILMLMMFNYGFMQVRIASVPLAEIALVLYLMTSNIPLVLKHFFSIVNPIPFILWWTIGIGGALYYLSKNGIWALRDATNAIESLYLIAGFAFFSTTRAQNLFIEKMPQFLFWVTLYALTYPFAAYLKTLSPSITAGSGSKVSLFFNYTNSSLMLMVSVLYFSLIDRPKNLIEKNATSCCAFIIIFAIGYFQERSLYLHLFALTILLIYLKPSLFKRLFIIGLGMIFLLFLISEFNINIEGRLGRSLSFEFLTQHISAMFGVSSSGLEGSAHGVSQRTLWWTNILNSWSQNSTNMIFGLGYGFPLIDFNLGHGVAVREPHNSYLSVLARSGLAGFLSWTIMHFCLFSVWIKLYRFYKSTHQVIKSKFLVIVMGYFLLVLLRSLVQDGFEKPFIAVPYYFLWGMVIRMYWNERYGTQQNPKAA
jgi:hypothetical protein